MTLVCEVVKCSARRRAVPLTGRYGEGVVAVLDFPDLWFVSVRRDGRYLRHVVTTDRPRLDRELVRGSSTCLGNLAEAAWKSGRLSLADAYWSTRASLMHWNTHLSYWRSGPRHRTFRRLLDVSPDVEVVIEWREDGP